MIDLIIHSAAQLLTIAGEAPKRGASQGELGIIENGAVAVSNGEIVAVGPSAQVLETAEAETRLISAAGKVVLPGFVDAHTHVVFAGDRASEFDLRLKGATYLDIMKAGGGIMSTVRATRAATLGEIVEQSRTRLVRMLTYGTTTTEVKTGYGLDPESENKLLDAIVELAASQPMDLVPTFLGAHAVPEEYKGREDYYVDLVVKEMLPAVKEKYGSMSVRGYGAREQSALPHSQTPTHPHTHAPTEPHFHPAVLPHSENAAPSYPFPPLLCDVFCDEGAFTLDQARRILEGAKALGYALKIHADEFANLGGAALAAELGAVSADHLMVTRRDEMQALARANVVAVLLPGTTFGLGKSDFANGRAFIDENVPVALGSDINPGTSWSESMPLMIAIATRDEKLTPAEAIVAATLNAAYASGVGERVGSLQPGKQADILLADVPDYRHLAYRYGTNPICKVIKRGKVVASG